VSAEHVTATTVHTWLFIIGSSIPASSTMYPFLSPIHPIHVDYS
jgi:hypothetical protein